MYYVYFILIGFLPVWQQINEETQYCIIYYIVEQYEQFYKCITYMPISEKYVWV